eukprot:tig00001286_g8030.t1
MQEDHGIEVERLGRVSLIRIARPTRKNALLGSSYEEITKQLKAADADEGVSCIVLTGAGDWFSSGNDLGNFGGFDPQKMQAMLAEKSRILIDFVDAFIDLKKPLVAAVNGPAIGIGVTILALADIVYASDTATFQVPFAALGQSPEACSSYFFPRIFGPALANELLLMGRKLTAGEGERAGFVAAVFPAPAFQKEVTKRVMQMASFPPGALAASKELVRGPLRELLRDVNRRETRVLAGRWASPEAKEAVAKFFGRARRARM